MTEHCVGSSPFALYIRSRSMLLLFTLTFVRLFAFFVFALCMHLATRKKHKKHGSSQIVCTRVKNIYERQTVIMQDFHASFKWDAICAVHVFLTFFVVVISFHVCVCVCERCVPTAGVNAFGSGSGRRKFDEEGVKDGAKNALNPIPAKAFHKDNEEIGKALDYEQKWQQGNSIYLL